MIKKDKIWIENIYNKKADECSNDELSLSILIPYYWIFEESDADILNNDGVKLERKSFMKEFNKILRKIKGSSHS